MSSTKLYLLLVTLLSVTVQQSLQASLPDDPYYTAGVVEFSPSRILNLREQLNDNLNNFIEIIQSEIALSTDIVIFPESTLNNDQELTFVPEGGSGVIPCDNVTNYHEFLHNISCVAKQARKYVVINLTEKEVCPANAEDTRPCASNGLNIYNTNVVFDRDGRVISRYRKVHLYGEAKNTTIRPEAGTFETDFGVRFGHFVCFDILFYHPAEVMVKSMGIKDFIYTTMWFGQLPFLTGVQTQHAWAYGNDVNLLAAGASVPSTGTTGTGIYNGRKGSIVSVMNQRIGERKIYIAQVPKFPKSPKRVKRAIKMAINPRLSSTDIFLKRDYLQSYVSVLVNLTDINGLQSELCFSNNFCCEFDLSWSPRTNLTPNSTYYTYRLGVLDTFRNPVAAETNHIKNCAIFSCIGDDIADCGKIFPDDTRVEPQVTFEKIIIEGSYPKSDEYLLMPNSLREDLLPLPVENFIWTETETESATKVRFELNKPTDDLLAMAIYGNYYDTEVEDRNDGGTAVKVSGILLTFVIAWFLY